MFKWLKTTSPRNHLKQLQLKLFNLPLGAGTPSTLAFSQFEEAVSIPFLNAFMGDIKETFAQLDFWLPFIVFDTRRLLEEQWTVLLVNYGEEELEKLLSLYWSD